MGRILSAYLCPHPPIIMKEVGKGQEKKVQTTIDSLNKVSEDIKDKKPTTIIVITPHGPVFRDAIAIGYEDVLRGDMSQFGHPEIEIAKDNNKSLIDNIINKSEKEGIKCAKIDRRSAELYNISTDLDHGVQVPLYFVDDKYKDYRLIHITYGMLACKELYKFGKLIQESISEMDEDVVVIASGDLSHKLTNDGPYEYNPAGLRFDKVLIDLFKEEKYEDILNIDEELAKEAGECGLKSIHIMLGTIDGYKNNTQVLSYEGTFGVGYGVVKIEIDYNNKQDSILDNINKNFNKKIKYIRDKEDEYVRLARQTLESYVKKGEKPHIQSIKSKDITSKKAGVFVSIKKDGNLRGCIGTIIPTKDSIGEEIIDNAIKAGTEDPRFYPVQESELDSLIYSVDILGKAEKIDSIEQLDPKRYGVIVTSGAKRGLLLPNLEGVDTVEEQLNITLRKAGIGKDENYNIERFEVIRHSPLGG